MGTIEQIKQRANPRLQLVGLVRTMFDPRSNLARDVSEQISGYFQNKVFSTTIPRNIRLAEAPFTVYRCWIPMKIGFDNNKYLAHAGLPISGAHQPV